MWGDLATYRNTSHRVIVRTHLRKINKVQDKNLLDHWLDIYAKGSVAELPEVKNQLLKIKRDLETYGKRNKNLIERLSDLPQDIPADGIYAQIKQNKNRIEELERNYAEIQCQERKLSTLSVSREGLVHKVKRAIENLEKTPIEKRRAIYKNLIKFAEVHPLKVKIGIYAPVVTSSTSVLSGGSPETRTRTHLRAADFESASLPASVAYKKPKNKDKKLPNSMNRWRKRGAIEF